MDNVSLKYFKTQTQVSAKQFRWHNTLVLMNVGLIHKPNHDNVVPDALNKYKEFEALNTTQTLWLMYKGHKDLQRHIREGNVNNPQAQRLLGKPRKGKALKEVKLLD